MERAPLRFLGFASLLVAWALICVRAGAQVPCSGTWLPGDGVPGVDGTVYAQTLWDPDGAGPRPSVLVIGGSFTVAGSAAANNIAIWDGVSFSPLGTGTNGPVRAITALSDGGLAVGGAFSEAGGQTRRRIAIWNGSEWLDLAGGMDESVESLVVLPSGDLVAGGNFLSAGGVAANRIARWSGAAWSALGAGFDRTVLTLAARASGELIAGGMFTTAGGAPASRIARWDGSAWRSYGSGANGTVRSIALSGDGLLVVGGAFTVVGGLAARTVASWDGTTWSAFGPGFDNAVYSVAIAPGGDIIAGGIFRLSGDTTFDLGVARWNGAEWTRLSGVAFNFSLSITVNTVAMLQNGAVLIGGEFSRAGGVPALGVARWDGSAWSALAAGFDVSSFGSAIYALSASPDGGIIAGGSFTLPGSASTISVARRDGVSWSALGTGLRGSVNALAVRASGEVFAGGSLRNQDGSSSIGLVQRWNGTAWSDLGSGLDFGGFNTVSALALLPNGDLIAAGVFSTADGQPVNNIAGWDGTRWYALGSGALPAGTEGQIFALAIAANGDLVAGGQFTSIGGVRARNIARWNGAAWSALGSEFSISGTVRAIVTMPNGDVIAAGDFLSAGGQSANRIARWDGAAWSPFGSGISDPLTSAGVYALAILPGNRLFAAGSFVEAGGVPANGIARWDGVAWSACGTGLRGGRYDPSTFALLAGPDGRLAAGGRFVKAGEEASATLAMWEQSPGPAISIVSQPVSVSACLGQTATFSIVASTTGRPTFHWLKDGVRISTSENPSAGTATLTIPGLRRTSAGRFRCVVLNECGSQTSTEARLTVRVGDFNCDGVSSPLDIFAFVSAYFARDPRTNVFEDNELTTSDVYLFLQLYFAGL